MSRTSDSKDDVQERRHGPPRQPRRPTPEEVPERDRMKELMPMMSPFMSTSGPPELPGLMAASVWIKN